MPSQIPASIAETMTGIEWCDFSGNAWMGCTRVPAASGARSGCELCYAATFAGRRFGVDWGPGVPRHPVATFAGRMRRLDRLAAVTGHPFSVFTMSLADWLDAEVEPAWRADFVDVVDACPHLTWLPLTHRPHLIRKLAPEHWRRRLPANIWPGVTVDHRAHARRWDELAEWWGDSGRAWVSAEPLASSLAGIPFDGACTIVAGGASNTKDPSWECDPAWIAELIEAHADRLFFKQKGDIVGGEYVGKRSAGREIDGRTFDFTAWPRHREILQAAKRAGEAKQ